MIASEMKKSLDDFKKLPIDKQKVVAKQSLIDMGYIDSDLNVLPPYNGKINDNDFNQGPGEMVKVKHG